MSSPDPTRERFERLRAAAARNPHGTRARYFGGCRCVPCRAANSRYECERAAKRAAGETNKVVPGDRVLAHLRKLSAQGVGYKTVADVARVGATSLQYLMAGKRAHVREETERRVLAVDATALADGVHVDARPTWALLNELLREGYSKAQMARWLGLERTIQFRRDTVTARTASRVERMYRMVRAGILRRDR